MRKRLKTLITLPALGAATPASATSVARQQGDPLPIMVGVTVGAAASNVLTLPIGYNYFSYYFGGSRFKGSVDLGVGFTQFRRKLTAKKEAKGRLIRKYFGFELRYSTFGARWTNDQGTIEVETRMITLPLIVRTDYRELAKGVRPTFQWGPQLGFKLSQKMIMSYSGGGRSYDLGYYMSYQPWLMGELGFHFGVGATIDLPGGLQTTTTLRYFQGLNPELNIGFVLNSQVGLYGAIQF